MSLANLTSTQRQRIELTLYDIRDLCYSAAGACLHTSRSVRMGNVDDELLLSELIGKLEQIRVMQAGLTREIGK